MKELEKLKEQLNLVSTEQRDGKLALELYDNISKIADREKLTEGDVIVIIVKTLAAIVATANTKEHKLTLEEDVFLISKAFRAAVLAMGEIKNAG